MDIYFAEWFEKTFPHGAEYQAILDTIADYYNEEVDDYNFMNEDESHDGESHMELHYDFAAETLLKKFGYTDQVMEVDSITCDKSLYCAGKIVSHGPVHVKGHLKAKSICSDSDIIVSKSIHANSIETPKNVVSKLGCIFAGVINVGENVTANNYIFSKEIRVCGDVTGGDIEASHSISVGGDIKARGGVLSDEYIKAKNIEAAYDISARWEILAHGNIKAKHSILAGRGIEAGGNIEAGEDYFICAGLKNYQRDEAPVRALEKPNNLILGKFVRAKKKKGKNKV